MAARDPSSKAIESITDEIVIDTLRSNATPETIYWLLRYYVEDNGYNMVVRTNRNKTLYIELDRIEDRVTIYVGNTDEVICVSEEKGNKVYAMDIQERYDYIWYKDLGFALKKQVSAEAILEQSPQSELEPFTASPSLFYTIGEESACLLRTSWYQSGEEKALPQYSYQAYLASVSEEPESLVICKVLTASFNNKSKATNKHAC